jgi:hypothetical protein
MPLDIIYNLLIRDPTLVASSNTLLKRKYDDTCTSTSSIVQGHKKRVHGLMSPIDMNHGLSLVNGF